MIECMHARRSIISTPLRYLRPQHGHPFLHPKCSSFTIPFMANGKSKLLSPYTLRHDVVLSDWQMDTSTEVPQITLKPVYKFVYKPKC